MNEHPIRLEVDDDLRRSRITVFLRLPLCAPHLVWLLLWGIAAAVAGLANWLATLVRGRSPLVLHRFLVAYIRYALHVSAFAFLGANPFPGFTGSGPYPIDVAIAPPERQGRWRVAFRPILVVPALLVASELAGRSPLAPVFGVGGAVATVAVLAWFAALTRGRMPAGLRDLIAYSLRYAAQMTAYLVCVTAVYPNADPAADRPARRPAAVDVVVADDLRRSRVTVFFRVLLAIPHLIWLYLWSIAVWFLAPIAWLVTLIDARPPEFFAGFYSSFLRYQTHVVAYLTLVANPYPGFLGRAGSYPDDLVVDTGERQNRWTIGFRIILAIPAAGVTSALAGPAFAVGFLGWFACLVTGRMPTGLRNLGAYALRYAAQTGAYMLLLTDRYPDSGPWLTVAGGEPAVGD